MKKKDGAETTFFGKKKKVHWFLYAMTNGPGQETIDIQTELERLADFASLPSARKLASRLELMLSSVKTEHVRWGLPDGTVFHSGDHFELIEEVTGNDGCGFIPGDLLVKLLGGTKAANRATSIQVVIVVVVRVVR